MQRLIERFRAEATTPVEAPRAGLLEALPGQGEAELDGRRALNFASGDALGLATDPRVKEAAHAATRRYGTQGGSGLQTMTALEERLASFLGREQAVVSNDAHALLAPLLERVDLAFADGRRPVWPTSALPAEPTRLADVDALETALQAEPEACSLVLASAIFADEGDLSALPRLSELSGRFGAAMVIDESRSLGVLGETGAGAGEQLLGRDVSSLVVASLDGALASRGVLLAGPAEIISAVRAGLFDGERPAPSSVAAALKALELLQAEPPRRQRLFDVTARLMTGLRALGLDTGPSVTPRIPIWVGDEVRCERFAQALLEAGVWCQASLVPSRARLLLLPQATHSDVQIDQAIDVIERVARKAGLLPESRPASVAAVELARPGTFTLSAACAPHWNEPQPITSEAAGARPRDLAARVFSAVETLTWRAANLRGVDVRKLLERPRGLLKRRK